METLGSQIWTQVGERLLVNFALLWVVIAIMVGLGASELKKRSFWLWVFLSLISGPIAWYLLFVKLPVYIPKDKRTTCPKCGKTINVDAKACPYCKTWISRESKDRAAEIGKQAATMVFTARTLLGRARKAADHAAATRRASADGKSPPKTPTA